MKPQELSILNYIQVLATPSSVQPEFVELVKAAHRIPVGRSTHLYFSLDRISFDCPLHQPAYGADNDEDIIYCNGYACENAGSKKPLTIFGHGPNVGLYPIGHRIHLLAQAGNAEIYTSRKDKYKIYICGYEIVGTKIHITTTNGQVLGDCHNDYRFSEELWQETFERWPRKCGYTARYASLIDGITATVREVK